MLCIPVTVLHGLAHFLMLCCLCISGLLYRRTVYFVTCKGTDKFECHSRMLDFAVKVGCTYIVHCI